MINKCLKDGYVMKQRHIGVGPGDRPKASEQQMDKLMMTNSVVQGNEHKLRKTRSEAGADRPEDETLKRTIS